MAVGDAAEVWAAHLAPATGLDHIDPGTLLVLDEPGDIAEAAAFLWRQADERRAELIEAGELPKDWPSTYLPPRDWKGRLVGVADARADLGVRAGRRTPRWPAARCRRATRSAGASPSCRSAVPGRLVDAVDGLAGGRRPDRPRLATRRRASPTSWARPAIRSRSSTGSTEAPPPGAIALDRPQPQRRLHRRPGRPRLRHRPRAVRDGPRPPAARRSGGSCPRDILERLTPGDLVVHIDHGVARYEQMLRRGGAGEERDYLELSFAGGDRIFVPVEQIGRVTRYAGGERPALSKLGGTEWLRAKQRVRKAVDGPRRGAARAVRRAGRARRATPSRRTRRGRPRWRRRSRTRRPSTSCAPPPRSRPTWSWSGRWTGSSSATSATARPRSRCGPRSRRPRTASRSRSSCRRPSSPRSTTRRSAQRFAAFPLEVRLLSRFVPGEGAGGDASTGLADGTVDIVIGTHRLLSKDVRFKDLGLVVVDEEQRFGVAAKERLKQLRREVDVLTLSATPDPADAQPGAGRHPRPVSVIETPPEDRLPIQTRVAEASAGLVRDAILRELDRGGQVFYVHNRVETIEAQAEQLRRMLPGARFVVGHGQMAEGALEKVMIAFADGAADVLVCTTIIESGLDIPNANTIIIDRADTLGLAQLYQLRGRVGRSSRRAYAYLLYRRRERLSRRGAQAAPGDLQRLGARAPGSRSRCPTSRSAAPATSSAASSPGTWRRSGSTSTRGCWPRRSRTQKATLRGPGADRRGAAGRRRPAGRGAPARRLRARTRPRSSSCTGGWPGPGPPATWPPSARRSPTASGRCRRRSSALVEVAELRLAAEAAGRLVDLARGGLAGRPVRGGADAGDGDAAAAATGLPGVRPRT